MDTSPFALLIKAKADDKAKFNRLVANQGNQFINTKLAILAEILEDITLALVDFELTVVLHVDSKRTPCPTIRINGDLHNHHGIQKNIAEIGVLITQSELSQELAIVFFAGSRDCYIHQFDNKTALLDHIADTIANDIDYHLCFTEKK